MVRAARDCGRDRREGKEEDFLEELSQLASSAGADVLYQVVQKRAQYDPACLIGRGKAEEIGELCRAGGVDCAIFNENLSPAQVRNLEEIIGVKVIDRTEVILDIFAQRARSCEGKLQVELAQLTYRLPRLVGKGVSLSRLGGGIGTRGPGETKLESDRRRIKKRIQKIERELETVRTRRALHRVARRSIPVIAMVGYTNAGKSTLLNRLTKGGAYVADKLFATLDPTIRLLFLSQNRRALLVDTVGFIRDLPCQLISAFKATLEEVQEAECLLHVVDSSHPQMLDQIAAVEKILVDLCVMEKPRIEVYNKIDCLTPYQRSALLQGGAKSVAISALTGEGTPDLLTMIESRLIPARERLSVWPSHPMVS